MSEYVKRLRKRGMHDVADYVERLEKPVKHGKWIPTYMSLFNIGGYKCSVCGHMEKQDGWVYCHCGALMDGKENSTAPDDDMVGYRDTV